MKRKRKKIFPALFSLVLVLSMTGCSRAAAAGEGSGAAAKDGTGGTQSLTGTDGSSADLNLEKKAEIDLSDGITVNGTGVEVLDDNIIFISEGGEYVFTGTLEDGVIYVDTEDSVELTLNGVTIANVDGPAILGQDSEAIYINLVSGTENFLSDGSEYETDEEGNAVGKGTIFSNDDLHFIGEGTLTVTGNYKHAIKSDDSIYVESGNFYLSAAKDGMNANDTLMVNGGTITITEAIEGLEGTDLVINDGIITVMASDDCLNAGTLLQINGGTIYCLSSAGDAVDSNGTLEITGGFLAAHGSGAPEGGLDCDENSVLITGGIVIATGGVNSSPDREKNTQYSILLGAASEGDTIGILDSEGNTVFAYETDLSYSNMVLSIPGITENETYTIYTGGTISGGTEFYGYYDGASYDGGSESQTFTADSMIISAGGTTGMGGGAMGDFKGGKGGGRMPEDVPAMGELPKDESLPEMGEFPGGGDMPEMGEKPEDRSLPEMGEFPGDGDMPNRDERVENGKWKEGMTEDGEKPEDGSLPEMGENPKGGNSAE